MATKELLYALGVDIKGGVEVDLTFDGLNGLLAGSSGFGPAWRVDGGKIVSLTA